jgi:hypothetical protein
MTKYTSIGVYEADLDRYSTICSLLHKEQSLLFHELISELEEALKRSVQNKGELCFNWQMQTQISGTTLSITFVPKAKVVSEQVPMDSEEPTANEIAEKTGVDSK